MCLFFHALHPSRIFSSQMATRIDKWICQMTNDNCMALQWPSFKKVNPKFSIKKYKSKEVQGLSTLNLSRAKEGEGWLYFIHFKHRSLDVFRKHYIVWSMMKSQLDIEKLVHTRVAYNPLLKVNLQVSTKFSSLQVINGSPTDWLNLNTAIKIVQNINIICALQEKTIVSLGMQLYAKCIQLQSKKEISNNFLFWLFKALGRYINNSGLDQAFA